MYAYLQGKFSYKSATQVFLDVNGVGYEVNISLNTFTSIQQLNEGKLYTYLQIKEDAHTLFGFFEKEEKDEKTKVLTYCSYKESKSKKTVIVIVGPDPDALRVQGMKIE